MTTRSAVPPKTVFCNFCGKRCTQFTHVIFAESDLVLCLQCFDDMEFQGDEGEASSEPRGQFPEWVKHIYE